MKNKIKKLKKQDIIAYYTKLAFPKENGLDFVPVDLQMKAMDKLLAWMGVQLPETVLEEKKLEKMTFEIRVAKD